MWLSDGLLGAPQQTPSSSAAPTTAPMPTIAEEEGSPDKHSQSPEGQPPAGLHDAGSRSKSPSQDAAATAMTGSDCEAPAAAPTASRSISNGMTEPAMHRLSSSFSFQPSLSLHPSQDAAPAAFQEASAAASSPTGPALAQSLFDRDNSSSSIAASGQQIPSSQALPGLHKTVSQESRVSGENAAPVELRLSGSRNAANGLRALQPLSLRQPYPEPRLIGSWEGLEHVGLEPLPSGGTSPDTAGAPRSRLGPSHNDHITRDDSLDGSRIPRLSFPGFAAGGPTESRDQALTSSTPKFSPKQHFMQSHAASASDAITHQRGLIESAELSRDLPSSRRSTEPHLVENAGTSMEFERRALPRNSRDRCPIGNLGDSSSFSGRNDSETRFALPMSSRQLQHSGAAQVGGCSNQTGSPQRSRDTSGGIPSADGGGSGGFLQPSRDASIQGRSDAEGAGNVNFQDRAAAEHGGNSSFQGRSAADGGASPVGRKSLEARRESMLRALSGGSSRSSSGDLSGSLRPQLFAAEPAEVKQVDHDVIQS